jgi:hypothetical protein
MVSMNEFRDALQDQTRQYVTKPEHDRTREDIDEVKTSIARYSGALAVLVFAVPVVLKFLE